MTFEDKCQGVISTGSCLLDQFQRQGVFQQEYMHISSLEFSTHKTNSKSPLFQIEIPRQSRSLEKKSDGAVDISRFMETFRSPEGLASQTFSYRLPDLLDQTPGLILNDINSHYIQYYHCNHHHQSTQCFM